VFGLSPVRKTMANKLSELSIGYPQSPLTQASSHVHASPAPGERAPVLDAAHPVGAGDTPRFALFGNADSKSAELIARHPKLLEPAIRPPFSTDGIWLVRPDGYVAMTAAPGDWQSVQTYLQNISAGAKTGRSV
jgi:hypothetical protein